MNTCQECEEAGYTVRERPHPRGSGVTDALCLGCYVQLADMCEALEAVEGEWKP